MKVAVISTSSAVTAEPVRETLQLRGHTIVEDDGLSEAEVGILVVAGEPEPGQLEPARASLQTLRTLGVPIRALTNSPIADLPASLVDLPHDEEWIVVPADDIEGIRAAVETIEVPQGAELGAEAPGHSERKVDGLRRLRKKSRQTVSTAERPVGGTSVFVSYSRKDRLADDVVSELQKHGHTVWRDTSSIAGGRDWRASIEDGIGSSEVFVLLMSPNAAKNALHVRQELQYASSRGRRLIPVYLRRTPTLPEGFSLILGGTQWISLQPSFQQGMGRLLEAIGTAPADSVVSSLSARAVGARDRLRRFAHEHEIAKKTKRYGGAMAAGAAVVAAGAIKVLAEEQERSRKQLEGQAIEHRSLLEESALAEREKYIERTAALLRRARQEISLAENIDPAWYRDEFRPNFQKVLGGLSALTPTDIGLQQRHQQMVSDLDKLALDYDKAVAKLEAGNVTGFARSVQALNASWASTVESNLEWLAEALRQ